MIEECRLGILPPEFGGISAPAAQLAFPAHNHQPSIIH
jgi:hypothetical protein